MSVIFFSTKKDIYPEFSNFYEREFSFNGYVWKCVEAPFQAAKTQNENEYTHFISLTGSEAKRKGRKVKLRPDWEQVKFLAMCRPLFAKFSQNEDLKELLLKTDDNEIVEDTTGWHDNIWGHCTCPDCINKPYTNLQGRALMYVRHLLKNGKTLE